MQTSRENIFPNRALLGYSPREIKEKEETIMEISELGEYPDLHEKYYTKNLINISEKKEAV